MAAPVGLSGHPRGVDKNPDQSCNFYREVLVGFLRSLRTLTGQVNDGGLSLPLSLSPPLLFPSLLPSPFSLSPLL